MYADSWAHPDPATQPEFFSGVPTKRLLAWVIDTALILALSLLILPFTAFTGLFFFPFLFLVAGFVYRWVTLTGASATWGMRAMAIEFRTADGQRFDGAAAFMHTLGFTVSVAFAPLQLVSIALILISEKGQSLTDHVLGTVAINRAR